MSKLIGHWREDADAVYLGRKATYTTAAPKRGGDEHTQTHTHSHT